MEKEKDLEYWKNNAEEDYLHVPISVLRYITVLEQAQPQDKETFLKAADERIIPNIKDHYFSHEMINEEGQYIELYEVYDILKWAFETLTKPQKDFLTWYTTGNNKHYSGDKLIEKYKKEVLNQ